MHILTPEINASDQPSRDFPSEGQRGDTLRTRRRLHADGLFGLNAPAPVDQGLDQLADVFTRPLIAQVHVLAEESGSMWHQHLRVGDHDGTDAAEFPSQ